MPELSITLKSLVTGKPIPNADYEISGWPTESENNRFVFVGGIIASGRVDSQGSATVELQTSPEDTYLICSFPEHNANFPFVMPNADSDLGTLAREYAEAHGRIQPANPRASKSLQ